jgi:hypothetical protein
MFCPTVVSNIKFHCREEAEICEERPTDYSLRFQESEEPELLVRYGYFDLAAFKKLQYLSVVIPYTGSVLQKVFETLATAIKKNMCLGPVLRIRNVYPRSGSENFSLRIRKSFVPDPIPKE